MADIVVLFEVKPIVAYADANHPEECCGKCNVGLPCSYSLPGNKYEPF